MKPSATPLALAFALACTMGMGRGRSGRRSSADCYDEAGEIPASVQAVLDSHSKSQKA